MAKYRQLHTQFWSDGFVLDLTPEEKYFYLYLMSNSKTSQCGVYELPIRIIEMETGYNRETVIKLLKRFEEYKKIKYCTETKEIMIFNWSKYNSPNNANAIKCVNKEIKNIKNKDFIKLLYIKYYDLHLDIKKIFEGVFVFTDKAEPLKGGSTSVTENIDITKDEEVTLENENIINDAESEEIVIDKKIEDSNTCKFEDVITFFKKNICKPKQYECKKLKEWSDNIDYDVIIMAITEATKYNAKNIKYIENVLYSWEEKGLKTKEDVEVYKKGWKGNKKYNSTGKDRWDMIEQRQYDFKELERKLLGWED
ncbi:DnaD domain protein [Clostridium oceanicum]|uniref:DnaD domain protein n=1 Tax=Clostridium oceanicum TaxID=1543 RepID=A0ABP3UKH4_9CLOT